MSLLDRLQPPRLVKDAEHSVVYRNDEEFCAWPFVGGLWQTRDGSLVVVFTRYHVDYGRGETVHHDNLSMRQNGAVVSLRSNDRGQTWELSTWQELFDIPKLKQGLGVDNPQNYAAEGPVDFTDKNVLVANVTMPNMFNPAASSLVRVSTDGGRNWRRPVKLPMTGLHSLSGQGSTMVRSDGVSLIALCAVMADGWTRRPLVYASTDGLQWNFLSFMTPMSDDGQAVSDQIGSPRFGAHRYFYPRPIQLRSGRILASMRSQRDPTSIIWTEMFDSDDGGRTWRFISRVNDWGAPGDIVEMSDGRIVCVYGYRLPAFGIRYRVSEDGGHRWGPEMILRNDGGSWDLGYPRVMEIARGKCLAVYYINLSDDPIQMNGGVRHIAQTVFKP